MNRKRTLIIILILFTGLFPLTSIPIAKASEATVSIQESEDDVWMTESGNIFGFEASVRMLDPEIGIRSFLRFEDVPLLKSSKINLATLNVYAGFDQGETISPGASVTIYGIDEPDCAPFSYGGQVWSLERPYTTASVNWNVSDWHQVTWQSVNVTSIVKEIINQYAWTQNNSIGFQILGASDTGYEYRTFEDIDHQHHGAYAYLYLQYDVAPGTPPGLPDTSIWVETYGEYDIWTVDFLDENRTGEGADVNWNLLNVTQLTEIDSGSDITVNNATWLSILDYQSQVWGCLFNDTGTANIDTFFLRFKINVTDVENDGAGNTVIPGFGGLSTSTPVGGVGLPYGASGEWVGIIPWCKDDDQSWRFSMNERLNLNRLFSGYSQWFDESSGDMLYVEFRVNVSGATKWMSYDVYDDPGFTNSIYDALTVLTLPTGPFRFAQIVPSLGGATGADTIDHQYYTYLESPLDPDEEYYLTDENGTVIDTWTQEGENFTDIDDLKDFVDDEIDPEGGDPLDPTPGTQGWTEEGPFTRFKMRLYFLIIGLGCIFGPLWAMAYKKMDSVGYAWCALIMILGTGLLWSITGI